MARQSSGEARAGAAFVWLGYACVAGLIVNIVARAGLIHVAIPGVTGYAARWGWLAGTAICFVVAWYLERGGREGRRGRP